MPRLFTALELPPMIGDALAMLRGGLPGARWVEPESYHVTLRFIGDIDDALARDVVAELGAVERAPLTLRLDGLDAFGGRRPRAVFASVAPNPALVELQAEHERLIQRTGIAPEGRKFTPHVTLARLRDASARQVADYLATRAGFRSPPFDVGRFVLMSSRASVGGGPYVIEAAYPLDVPARAVL